MDIVIEGARPYDGRYPMPKFNRYEQGQIRRLTDWMPVEYSKALEGGDAEFVAALAVLAMRRGGRIKDDEVKETFALLLQIDEARITLDGEDEEVDERPPPQSSSLSSAESGLSSSRSSEISDKTPRINGMHDSDTSGLVRVRSVS